MHSIISRYIFKEIAYPFIIILFVLTFVLLMGKILQIMDLMVNKGINLLDIARLIVYLLPSFMLFTIPIALLIAILIALGRLSADNEITAIKASGVNLLQIYYPAAIASLITFVFTIIIGYYIVPHSNFATKRLLFDITSKNASIGIKEKVFFADFKGIILYAERIPPGSEYMEGVFISDNRITSEQSTVVAKRAYLVSDPKSMTVKLSIENGSIHSVSADLKSYRKIDFKNYDIILDISNTLAGLSDESKKSTEMTLNEILDRMKKPGIDEAAARELAIEVHKKFSLPLSCIFFALLAVPLGIRGHRAVKARGFAIGLIVVSLYYLLRIGGEALVETGRLAPAIGVWAPNFIYALLGAFLFYISFFEISPWHEIKIGLWRGKT